MIKCKINRRFKRLLKSARQYEIVYIIDLFLSCRYPQDKVVCRVEDFLAGLTTWGEAFESIDNRRANDLVEKHCGIKLKDSMYFTDIMKLKPELNYKVIRFSLKNGEADEGNRSEDFKKYYQDL